MAEQQKRKRRWRSDWVPQLTTYEPPGTLSVSPGAHKPSMRLIAYGPSAFVDESIGDLGEIQATRGKYPVTWLNVDGLGDAATVKAIGEMFGLHGLALEDVLQPNQRPKVDEYESYLLIVARMLDRASGRLGTEQLSLIVGKDYVLSFQERPGDCLDAIRLRAREHRGRVRDAGADYLAYAILDAVVDEYFPAIEELGGQLEQLEDEALVRPQPGTATRVHGIKRDLLVLRRAMWPLRDAVNGLQRDTSPLVGAETRIYLRDCYDHCMQVLDLVEVYRDLCTGLMELYMTSINHRMNDVMRLLTIISTIFIPLTFVVGIYGMNFEYLPELHWRWGYPLVMAAMAALALGMLGFFRRKGWLGGAPSIVAHEDTEEDAARRA